MSPPVPDANLRERLEHLDVLRGFALLGILLVNFQWFTRPIQAIVLGPQPGLAGVDLITDFAIATLAEGKFYPLFSMLFGVGFALLAERARRAGVGFHGLYLRRLAVLAAFGLAHVALVWSGDILLVYALCALLMVLLFSNTPPARLWKWALLLVSLPAVLISLLSLLLFAMDADLAVAGAADGTQDPWTAIERAEYVYSTGRFAEVVGQRFADFGFLLANALFWVPPVLGYFLLGRWLLDSGLLRVPLAHARTLRRLGLLGLAAGLPLSAYAAWQLYDLDLYEVGPALMLAQWTSTAGALLLALGYLAIVTLASVRLAWLAPLGRMALSNYLLQSLFWTWVFYGYGLGLWGQVPRAWHPALAVLFFSLQIVMSHWWLRRFEFGPAEWLWRSFTYGRRQPFLRG